MGWGLFESFFFLQFSVVSGYCEPSLSSSENVVDRELTWKEMGKKTEGDWQQTILD